jgi:hypothetical protein
MHRFKHYINRQSIPFAWGLLMGVYLSSFVYAVVIAIIVATGELNVCM